LPLMEMLASTSRIEPSASAEGQRMHRSPS
jgi:hypothetical protein